MIGLAVAAHDRFAEYFNDKFYAADQLGEDELGDEEDRIFHID